MPADNSVSHCSILGFVHTCLLDMACWEGCFECCICLFCVWVIVWGSIFKSKQAGTFFSKFFTNDGIFFALVHLFYLYWFCISMLNFIATFKGLYFHTFCILLFIYQFPCASECTLRCIFLWNSSVYFLIIEIPKNSTSKCSSLLSNCFGSESSRSVPVWCCHSFWVSLASWPSFLRSESGQGPGVFWFRRGQAGDKPFVPRLASCRCVPSVHAVRPLQVPLQVPVAWAGESAGGSLAGSDFSLWPEPQSWRQRRDSRFAPWGFRFRVSPAVQLRWGRGCSLPSVVPLSRGKNKTQTKGLPSYGCHSVFVSIRFLINVF